MVPPLTHVGEQPAAVDAVVAPDVSLQITLMLPLSMQNVLTPEPPGATGVATAE
jgi:hypothetical protein